MELKILKRIFERKQKHAPQKDCITCHEQIHAAARVCHHCGSYQNWRRHLDFGNLSLALVVAFVSVISMGVPLILQAIKPDNSEISIAYIDRADAMVSIIASNKGTRMAMMNTLAFMTITILDNDQVEKEYKLVFRNMNDADAQNNISARNTLSVPEGTSLLFYYGIMLDEITERELVRLSRDRSLTIDNIQQCEFKVIHINFDGKEDINSLVIFDRLKIQEPVLSLLGSMNCLNKIPEPLVDKYKLFL
ncbi:hypothetical protein C8R34_10587 [Nitrosomonas sp. Nm84]|nr:hypothetical protein C8R34_10587 [Nitrosomonas sp. Nm84]